jgi:hypothetical protein
VASQFGFTAWDDVYNLVDGLSGKQFLHLLIIGKDRDVLIFRVK